MTIRSQTDALRLLSALLHYPDDDLPGDLPQMQKAAAQIAPGGLKHAIDGFLRYLAVRPLLDLQTDYTAAFDLNPSTTLNLTWHRYGENEQRAAALARLQQLYEDAGWERITGELPDYLPLMLEFLSVCPDPEKAADIWACLQGMETFIERLGRAAPAYAALLQPLLHMAAGQADAGRDPAAASARHSPEKIKPQGA